MAEKSDNKAKMAQKDEDGMMVSHQTGWGPRERAWQKCLALSFRLRDLDLISFGILGNNTTCAHQTERIPCKKWAGV